MTKNFDMGDLFDPRGENEPVIVRTDTMVREDWLNAAVEIFRKWFDELGGIVTDRKGNVYACRLPRKIDISIGLSGRGLKYERFIMGVTFATAASTIGVNEVFISPLTDDPIDVLETILHELVHVADDCASGHKGYFAAVATALGFEGPMEQTPTGVALAARLITVANELGPYPHSKMDADIVSGKVPVAPVPPGGTGGVGVAEPERPGKVSSGPSKQGTRSIKLSCKAADCPCGGYTVRTTRIWINIGFPRCPMGNEMGE